MAVVAVVGMGASSKLWIREFIRKKREDQVIAVVLSFQLRGHINDLYKFLRSLKETIWFSFFPTVVSAEREVEEERGMAEEEVEDTGAVSTIEVEGGANFTPSLSKLY